MSLIEAIQASDELDEWSRAYLLGLARKILDALIMYRFRGVEPLIDVSAVVHGSVEKNPNRTRFTDTHAFKVFGAVLLTLDTTLSIATGIKELVGGETGRSVPAVIEQRVQPAEPSPPDLIPLPIDAEVVGADPD